MTDLDNPYLLPPDITTPGEKLLYTRMLQIITRQDTLIGMLRRMVEVMCSEGVMPLESMEYILSGSDLNYREAGNGQ